MCACSSILFFDTAKNTATVDDDDAASSEGDEEAKELNPTLGNAVDIC